jgi:hypothetical protein
MVMKSSVQDTSSYSPLKIDRRFGGTCWLHIQGRGVSQVSNKPADLPSCWFRALPILQPEDGDDMFLGNIGLFSTTRSYIAEERTFLYFNFNLI